MKKYLNYQDEKSDKFWQIETVGNSFTVSYGKTGTAGQTQTKTFGSEAECEKAAEKLVNEKLKKGYVESDKTTKVSQPIKSNDISSNIIDTEGDEYLKYVKEYMEDFYEINFRKISQRYQDFLQSGEYQKYQNMYVLIRNSPKLPHKLDFIDKYIVDMSDHSDYLNDFIESKYSEKKIPFFWPFSKYHKGPYSSSSIRLYIDVSTAECAIYEFDECNVRCVDSSLDKFLDALKRKDEITIPDDYVGY